MDELFQQTSKSESEKKSMHSESLKQILQARLKKDKDEFEGFLKPGNILLKKAAVVVYSVSLWLRFSKNTPLPPA